MQLIRDIEAARGSRVLVYITGDRQGLETRIAFDVFPFIFEHLTRMGAMEKLDLFLYSPGGLTIAGYGIANLLREFCDSYNVIIPFKALSTATLISLGAKEILMTKFGQLSPIDPSIEHVLGPTIKSSPGQETRVPINVEDAISYLELARGEGRLKEEESLSKAFERLSNTVHPLALGAVNRVREQIRFLAKNLLKKHVKNNEKMVKIVDTLTKERFSHDYLIGRNEAKQDLRLNVLIPTAPLEQKIVDLYLQYDSLMQLRLPYNAETYLGSSNQATIDLVRGIVETDSYTHVFRTVKQVTRVQQQVQQQGVSVPVVVYQEIISKEGWELDNTI